MATLVLSTVGTAFGGPIGGAIGALVGQSIDRQVLSPSGRSPHLGDLSVQTSSYGTQVPRIYGTMRVAGSVIWATDLVESSETTGAKGQPDSTFSYAVSLAVAVSSRPVTAIKRIWADGKLLRGEDGEFKVSTTFRFYDGSEDQIIDPLIASIEGIANTPAYRGLAIAVFENLELAEFGNRIPFLTFEVSAEDAPVPVETILGDASNGEIRCQSDRTVIGYAAYGSSVRAAIQPLISCYAIDLSDDGAELASVANLPAVAPTSDELGNSADGNAAPLMEREHGASAPAIVRLSYYDPAREFQAGEARASASERSANEEHVELPAVVAAADAKSLAQETLARRWAEQEKMIVRLNPSYLGLEPGRRVDLPASPSAWTVEKCSLEAFVVIAELAPARPAQAILAADAGRIVANADFATAELKLALVEAPEGATASSEPTLFLAASSPTGGWRSHSVDISYCGRTRRVRTARRKSALGRTVTKLGPDDASVDVELHDADQWLVSCADEDFALDANLAVVGKEVIQFGDAVPLGGGRFRLGRLLRARAGTKCAKHGAGAAFVLIQRDALQPITFPRGARGSRVHASGLGGTAECLIPGPQSV